MRPERSMYKDAGEAAELGCAEKARGVGRLECAKAWM